jgi:hypothetical protein
MDQRERADKIEPTLAAEPIENAEASEPTDATDRIEPADPIDRIEPAEPIDRIEPLDPMLRMEPEDPGERDEPGELRIGTFWQVRWLSLAVGTWSHRTRGPYEEWQIRTFTGPNRSEYLCGLVGVG